MEDHGCIVIAPPNHSTIRFNKSFCEVESLIKNVKEIIAAEISFKYSESQHGHINFEEIIVQRHPVVTDVLVIDHVSIGKILCAHNENNRPPLCDKLKEAIVDTRCGVSVMRGSHIYIPGILSISPGVCKNSEVNVFVDIDKKCLKGAKGYNGKKFYIGKGVCLYNRKAIFGNNDVNSGIGIKMSSPLYPAPSLDNKLLPKHCFAQNLPSIVASHVLCPVPGSTVLDMCAAPGGKTTHLCSVMQNKGHVIALDKSKTRLNKIIENAELLECMDRIHTFAVDSRDILSKQEAGRSLLNWSPPYAPASFLYILLDAPCSGLGQRPRFMVDSINEKELKSFPPMQKQLFKTAVELLALNGILVYCTCTNVIEENECIVEWALQEFENLKLCEQSPYIGCKGRKGITNLTDAQLNKLQCFPMPSQCSTDSFSHAVDRDTIGFFIAKFTKQFSNSKVVF